MSRLWVKICANTCLADAQHAIRAGADAVGFVFASESKRRVTPEHVAAITPHLPAAAEKIGVFVEQEIQEIVHTVRAAGLTGVQMHAANGENVADGAALLRESLNGLAWRVKIVQVLQFSLADRDSFERRLRSFENDRAIDAILIDSRVPYARGGTGVPFDWDAARNALLSSAPHMRLIVAGGLTPENVSRAVSALNPWGVDVASGVEAAAGVKDPRKVERFIAAARKVGAANTAAPSKA